MNQKLIDILPEAMVLEGAFFSKEVRIGAKRLHIKASQRVYNHSAEFNWGYGGSGPAQLALAILLKYWDKENAETYHQDFKFAFIGGLPSTDFIKTVNLREIMRQIVGEREVKHG